MDHTVTSHLEATLQKIAAQETGLMAFVEQNAAQALAHAARLDALPAARHGPLHGMPIAVKEIFDVSGLNCAWGSPLHTRRRPTGSAGLVTRLTEAGAVVVGITRSTEYALAAEPPTRHPLDSSRSPGASSSGSAAAVGAGLVPLALGSQTIGSTIRPAAYCGVVGFKPSLGRYAGDGMLALCAALDHPGLLADNMATLRLVDPVLAGQARSANPASAARPTLCLVPPWWQGDPASEAVQSMMTRVAQQLSRKGLTQRQATVPQDVAATEAAVVDTLLSHDFAQRHGRFLLENEAQVSDELMGFVHRGQRVSTVAYAAARNAQDHITRALQAWLLPCEVALMPATVDVAPIRGEGSGSRAPQRLWTLAGMPALTLPAGQHDGLPLGLQLVGRSGEDQALLRCASEIETCLRDAT